MDGLEGGPPNPQGSRGGGGWWEGNLARRSYGGGSRPPQSHRLSPAASSSLETARCGPGSREVQGRGWRLCSSGAGPAQRGQEARTPGIVSRNHSPAPVREEVLPGALRRCLPGYIVEQETRQRGSRTVEEGARDAEPTRACRGKWRRGRRADAPRCPGKQGSGKEPRPGPLLIQPETLSSSGRPCAGNPARSFSRPGRDASGKALLRFGAASPASPLETPPRAMVGA